MRTDSVNVAQEAQAEARALIAEQFGPEYVPPEPNVYKARAKNAQEAHEAIRPTSVRRRRPHLRGKLTPEQFRLYELIWQRFMASQMAAAVYDTLTVDVEAGQPAEATLPLSLPRQRLSVRFPGFLAVYSGGASGPAEKRWQRRAGRARGTRTGELSARRRERWRRDLCCRRSQPRCRSWSRRSRLTSAPAPGTALHPAAAALHRGAPGQDA